MKALESNENDVQDDNNVSDLGLSNENSLNASVNDESSTSGYDSIRVSERTIVDR